MLAIITNKFRIHNAKSFIEGFSELDGIEDLKNPYISRINQRTNIYLFIGKYTSWKPEDKISGANSQTSDSNPPIPQDTVQNIDFELWRNMIAAKKVNPNDVKHVIPRHDWKLNNDGSGKIYSQYDDLNKSLFSNTSSPFYVFTDEFNVYKCISNNNGAKSTVKPTGRSSTQMIKTSDGYVWKYMYSVSPGDSLKFVTPEHIPVQTLKVDPNTTNKFTNQDNNQWEVQKFAVDGGIHSVSKISEGRGYPGLFGKIFRSGIYDSSNDTTKFKVSQNDAIFREGMIDGFFDDMAIFFNNSSVRRVFHIIDFVAPDPLNSLSMAEITVKGRADLNSPIFENRIPLGSTFEIAPRVSVEGDYVNGIIPADGIGFSCVARLTDDKTGNNTYGISSIEILSEGKYYKSCPINFKTKILPEIKAEYRAIISPKGGHGSDPIEELGGFYVMMNVKLEYDEKLSNLTVDNDYRQIGLVQDPIDSLTNEVAENLLYIQTKTIDLELESVNIDTDDLPFLLDEIITNENGVYGKILDYKDYDLINNTTGAFVPDQLTDKIILKVGNIFGPNGKNFSIGDIISTVRSVTKIDAKVKNVVSESLIPYSGEILYLEQRRPISRDIDQIEDIKIIIEF